MAMKKRWIASFILAALIAVPGTQALAQQTNQSRPVRPAAVTGELLDIPKAYDGRVDTRATSGRADYIGMSFMADLGGEQNIIGIAQDHGRWPTHFPGAYKVEVGTTAQGPWMLGWQGEGQRGESKAKFEAIRGRFIRVTATAVNPQYKQEWSVAELTAGVDPGQKPRIIPKAEPPNPQPTPQPNPGPLPPSKELKDAAKATDGKLDTFATSATADYAGMFLAYDLGGEYELSRVVQLHGDRAEQFAAEYKIEVSRERNENRFREVWRGAGQSGRSMARFDPVVTRYVRITALRPQGNGRLWSIAELQTNRTGEVVGQDEDDQLTPRAIRSITAQGVNNINALVDDNNTTRATTPTTKYAGASVQVDLGGSYTISRVVQVHEPDGREFPGRYRIEVSTDSNRWQTVFEGAGERGRSAATFTPVRARFLRITATASRSPAQPWSLYKLKIRG
ncbi:MAG: beta-galactosidase [Blastocatellia bacterium]